MKAVVTTIRSFRLFHWAVFALVGIATFTVVYHQQTDAACYLGRVLGRTCYRGYFNNVDDRGGTNVLPVISNGQALPSSSINSADSLVDLLYSAYRSGNNQKRTGAAFIYNTMMNHNAPGIGRNVSDAQWNTLRIALRGLDTAKKIRWDVNVSASINSYWQGTFDGFNPDGTNDDDAYYDNYKNEPGIEIRDYNNNVIYKILRRCANPIGAPGGGIPNPQNYTLTPHVDAISPTQIEAGSKMTVNSSVDNIGNTSSPSTRWEITQINVNPGKQAPHENNAGANPLAPCQSGGGAPAGDYFRDGNSTCKNVASGNGVFNLGSPSPNLRPSVSGLDVGDLPVGTRVCFALSVQPHSNTDGNWMHSNPVCTVIGKKPKVQIWGSDIAVRGKIETSTTVKNVSGATQVFGSWVEYGAFSVGTNSRFASASGLNGQTDNSQATWSKLTFANINSAGAPAFGNFTTPAGFRGIPTVAGYFAALPNKQPIAGGSVDVSNLTFATGSTPTVQTAGNLTITGGNMPAGRSVVILASGTVTITGNITYTNAALTSLQSIPQVVIIANNINIQDNVRQIDAWLVTSDTLNTCYNFTGNLTSGKCNQPLAVNGPVITGRLILNRTAGGDSGAQSGDPAERFNLRPDAFLWAQLQASGNNKAQTVYSTELPPRF
ncbi:MAG TPA: hypothetical protein VIQ80_02360 [Candidatus Saccharimonadales bacterium]